jgi:hypothetical protein
MPALVAGIHACFSSRAKDVDGRDKPGHDVVRASIIADAWRQNSVRCRIAAESVPSSR